MNNNNNNNINNNNNNNNKTTEKNTKLQKITIKTRNYKKHAGVRWVLFEKK